jgi:hypothetical protein
MRTGEWVKEGAERKKEAKKKGDAAPELSPSLSSSHLLDSQKPESNVTTASRANSSRA